MQQKKGKRTKAPTGNQFVGASLRGAFSFLLLSDFGYQLIAFFESNFWIRIRLLRSFLVFTKQCFEADFEFVVLMRKFVATNWLEMTAEMLTDYWNKHWAARHKNRASWASNAGIVQFNKLRIIPPNRIKPYLLIRRSVIGNSHTHIRNLMN